MRRLRIAFCEERYHSFYGAQQQILKLAHHLPQERFSPVVLTTREGELARRARAAGLPVHLLPMADIANRFGGAVLRYGSKERAQVALELLRYNAAFGRWLAKERIDAVLAGSVRFALALGLGAKRARVPLLVYHQGELKRPWLLALGLGLSTRFLLVADALESELAGQWAERWRHKVRTLYTGFRFEPIASARARGRAFRERWQLPADAYVIGLIGSVTPFKGADVLLVAAPAILRRIPRACFVLVGDSPPGHEAFRAELERRAFELGLGERFRLLGFQDDMPAVYGALDACVLPSRTEGLPGVVIEALGHGLPCVATDVGGCREILRDARYGRLIPAPAEASQLAEQVLALWRAEPTDGALARERAAFAAEAFSLERYVGSFARIVDEVVRREPPGRG